MDIAEFVDLARTYFGWTDLSDELVMDIGCGLGGSYTYTFANLFPNVQKIIAINSNPAVISKAQHLYSHPKIEFCVANIENCIATIPWIEMMPKIISFDFFTGITQLKMAFENMYMLLKPGGEAAILLTLHQLYFAYQSKALIEHPRWKEYMTGFTSSVPENHFEKFEVAYLTPIFESIGFTVVVCKEAQKCQVYQSDEDCKNYVTSRLLLDQIPMEYKEEFRQTAFEIFLRYHPKETPSSLPCFTFKAVSVLLKKPLPSFATL